MNRENSGYTIIYASVMVILVALGLSFTHQTLSEQQTANVNIDKMQQILRSLNIDAEAEEAQAKFTELITDAYLIDDEGNVIEGTEGIGVNDPAFTTEMTDDTAVGLPIYEAQVDGSPVYILPMSGSGLWGAIWGYLAVKSNGSTLYGSEFGHAGETPGLGAEIAYPDFRNQFQGKELFRDDVFTSIAVVKPGKSDSDRDYIDGISGGTITSQGVDKMLYNSISRYKNFLVKLHSDNNNVGSL